MFLRPQMEDDWTVVKSLEADADIDPVTCADVLSLGLAMFVVGYASGQVKLFLCDSG